MPTDKKTMTVTVTGGAHVNNAPPAPAVHRVTGIKPLPLPKGQKQEVQK